MKAKTLSEIKTLTGGMAPTSMITERDFRERYPVGSAQHQTWTDNLRGIDRTTTLEAFTTSTDDSWRTLVPEFFLDRILHVEVKTPDFAAELVPSTITVNRDPAVILGLDIQDDRASAPSWQFIAENASIDQAMHQYLRREVALREFGTGWALSRNLLSDIPLDVVSHRLAVAASQLRIFEMNWLTSELYESTSGAFETTYANAMQCRGANININTASNNNMWNFLTEFHGISIVDILDGLYRFQLPVDTPDRQAQGRTVKGTLYYRPTHLVLNPHVLRDIAVQLIISGYSQFGPETLSSQVRQVALIETLFGVRVIPSWSCRWLPDETHVPGNQVYIDDCYIVDNTWLARVAHSDGWFAQQWFENTRRINCWAQSRRQQFVAMDPKGVMRLKPAPEGS